MPLEEFQKYAIKRTGTNVVKSGADTVTYKHVSTGSFILDFALNGGWPENTVCGLVGKEHSGKTLLVYKALGNFQRKYNGIEFPKKYAAFVDVERQFNGPWAERNGVNIDELYVVNPNNAEEAVDLTAALMDEEEICAVALDSIPALVGAKEIDKSAEDALQPGSVAVHANRLLRKVSTSISVAHNKGERRTLMLVNQWRVGIGSAPHMPRTMPGGKFSQYYQSTMVEVYKDKEITGSDENSVMIVDHNDHSFKIHKNRTGNSITEGEFTLNRNSANGMPVGYIDDSHTTTTYAQKFGLLGGAGTGWWLKNPLTGETEKFKSKGDIQQSITGNELLKHTLERIVISEHRKKQGLVSEAWWA